MKKTCLSIDCPERTGGECTATPQEDEELLNILEPHYVNQGFEWGNDAREAARKSVTFRQMKARDERRERKIRMDELRKTVIHGKVKDHYAALRAAILTQPQKGKSHE